MKKSQRLFQNDLSEIRSYSIEKVAESTDQQVLKSQSIQFGEQVFQKSVKQDFLEIP
jgi:hypothetical protein